MHKCAESTWFMSINGIACPNLEIVRGEKCQNVLDFRIRTSCGSICFQTKQSGSLVLSIPLGLQASFFQCFNFA